MTNENKETKEVKQASAIIRVSYYQAHPVQCCDRCSQGIKHVFVVSYKDGLTAKFGSECINKVLAGDTTLKGLFKKNSALLQKYIGYLAVLNMPPAEMPVGSKYFDRGLNFIGDGSGDERKSIFFDGHWLFHVTVDMQKNAVCEAPIRDHQKFQADCLRDIEQGKVFLHKEIARIEGFLARIINKGLLK